MKNFLKLFLIFAISTFAFHSTAHAQIAKKITVVKDSTVNTGTMTIDLPVDNTVKAVEIHLTKVNGTVAGTATLQGTVDGTNWETVGTALTLTDVATQYKIFSLTSGLSYASYRFYVAGSGTNKIKPIVAWVLKRN